jgi:homoserine/homoserine lactone efflux protein
VISQATRYGWRAGFRGVLGIQLGNFVFFLCIAFGLIALLSTATHAFVILQLAGAVYLLYLGLRIIITSLRSSADALQGFGLRAERRSLVAQALFVQLTNPKALLFVSALLPQFLDSHRLWCLSWRFFLAARSLSTRLSWDHTSFLLIMGRAHFATRGYRDGSN